MRRTGIWRRVARCPTSLACTTRGGRPESHGDWSIVDRPSPVRTKLAPVPRTRRCSGVATGPRRPRGSVPANRGRQGGDLPSVARCPTSLACTTRGGQGATVPPLSKRVPLRPLPPSRGGRATRWPPQRRSTLRQELRRRRACVPWACVAWVNPCPATRDTGWGAAHVGPNALSPCGADRGGGSARHRPARRLPASRYGQPGRKGPAPRGTGAVARGGR